MSDRGVNNIINGVSSCVIINRDTWPLKPKAIIVYFHLCFSCKFKRKRPLIAGFPPTSKTQIMSHTHSAKLYVIAVDIIVFESQCSMSLSQQEELRTETRRKSLLILIYQHLLGQGSVWGMCVGKCVADESVAWLANVTVPREWTEMQFIYMWGIICRLLRRQACEWIVRECLCFSCSSSTKHISTKSRWAQWARQQSTLFVSLCDISSGMREYEFSCRVSVHQLRGCSGGLGPGD